MKRFHLHIYFEPKQIETARAMADSARSMNLFEAVKFHEKPVGPHPTGMFETHFSERAYPEVLEWVEKTRGEFSALIHEDTGDDLKDHTLGSRWLGKKVPLDFSFFTMIQERPDLKINP